MRDTNTHRRISHEGKVFIFSIVMAVAIVILIGVIFFNSADRIPAGSEGMWPR